MYSEHKEGVCFFRYGNLLVCMDKGRGTEREWKQLYSRMPQIKDFLKRNFSVGLKCNSKSRAINREGGKDWSKSS